MPQLGTILITTEIKERIERVSRISGVHLTTMERNLNIAGSKLTKFKSGRARLYAEEYKELCELLTRLEESNNILPVQQSKTVVKESKVDPELAEQHSLLDKLGLAKEKSPNHIYLKEYSLEGSMPDPETWPMKDCDGKRLGKFIEDLDKSEKSFVEWKLDERHDAGLPEELKPQLSWLKEKGPPLHLVLNQDQTQSVKRSYVTLNEIDRLFSLLKQDDEILAETLLRTLLKRHYGG